MGLEGSLCQRGIALAHQVVQILLVPRERDASLRKRWAQLILSDAPVRDARSVTAHPRASVNLAQTTMRSEIGKLTLGKTYAERDRLNDAIVTEIDKASDRLI